jgi:uncharacterized membrane protein YccC
LPLLHQGAAMHGSTSQAGLVGAAAYMVTYPMWTASGMLTGEKLTVGAVPGATYEAIFPNVSGDLIGIVLGLVFIAAAFAVPDQIRSNQKAVHAG